MLLFLETVIFFPVAGKYKKSEHRKFKYGQAEWLFLSIILIKFGPNQLFLNLFLCGTAKHLGRVGAALHLVTRRPPPYLPHQGIRNVSFGGSSSQSFRLCTKV